MSNELASCDQVQTVDALLKQVSILHQSELWKTTQPVIKVQGVASKINQYGKWSYFTLNGTDSALTVKCLSKYAPSENQLLVVEGSPFFKPSNFPKGIEIVIEGKPQKSINEEEQTPGQVSIKKESYLKLSQLVDSMANKKIAVIGSEIGIKDLLSHVDSFHTSRLQNHQVSISDKSAILDILKKLNKEVCAVVFVRGGDDETLEIWNDNEFIEAIVHTGLPFYVALGHAHRVFNISLYSDESFATPTAFGVSLNQAFKINQQLSDLDQENDELKTQLSDLKHHVKRQESKITQLTNEAREAPNKATDEQKEPIIKDWVIALGVLFLLFLVFK